MQRIAAYQEVKDPEPSEMMFFQHSQGNRSEALAPMPCWDAVENEADGQPRVFLDPSEEEAEKDYFQHVYGLFVLVNQNKMVHQKDQDTPKYSFHLQEECCVPNG